MNLVAELPVKVILGYLVDEWLVFRILRYQAKDITPWTTWRREALKKKAAVDIYLWKAELGAVSMRQTLKPFQRQQLGKLRRQGVVYLGSPNHLDTVQNWTVLPAHKGFKVDWEVAGLSKWCPSLEVLCGRTWIRWSDTPCPECYVLYAVPWVPCPKCHALESHSLNTLPSTLCSECCIKRTVFWMSCPEQYVLNAMLWVSCPEHHALDTMPWTPCLEHLALNIISWIPFPEHHAQKNMPWMPCPKCHALNIMPSASCQALNTMPLTPCP